MSRNRTKPPSRKAAKAEPITLSTWLVPVVIMAVFLPAIFLLPYYVPMHVPANSQSWEFGYNNFTAQELIALMLLAVFGWRLFMYRGDYAESPITRALVGGGEGEGNRNLWLTMTSFQLLSAALLIVWYCVLPYTHYGEFTYFMQRLETYLTGLQPYTGFEYDYGLELLGLPLLLYRLFSGFLSIEFCYFVILLMHFAVGYALLAYMVSRVQVPRGKSLLYLLLAIPFTNLSMGLQWTPIRFTIALASIFAIRHADVALAGNARRRWIVLSLGAFLFPLLNFLLSPEMGLAVCFALFVYFGWHLILPDRRPALLLLPLVGGIVLSALVLSAGYFRSIFSFQNGGVSLPIFPTMHILFFLGAAVWVFPVLGVIAIRDKSAAAPFCAGLAIMLGLFILPAMGRCDPGHIFINSAGLFLVTLCAAAWLAPRWRYSVYGVYALVFVVLYLISLWDHYEGPMMEALQARSEISQIKFTPDNYADLAPGAPRPAIHYSKLLPTAPWVKDLPTDAKIGIPLSVDESTERYLRVNGRLSPSFYIAPYTGIFTQEDIQKQCAQIDSMEYLLIPQSDVAYLRPMNPEVQMRMQGEADCKFLSGLLLFPVDCTAIHTLFEPNFAIMRHIAENYGLAKQFPGVLLLKRKPKTAAAG